MPQEKQAFSQGTPLVQTNKQSQHRTFFWVKRGQSHLSKKKTLDYKNRIEPDSDESCCYLIIMPVRSRSIVCIDYSRIRSDILPTLSDSIDRLDCSECVVHGLKEKVKCFDYGLLLNEFKDSISRDS